VGLVLIALSAPAAIFVVTNASDAGPGTLREAITNANIVVGTDVIRFNIGTTPAYSLATIVLTNALPPIMDPIVIEGATQTSNSCPPGVELDGTAVPLALGANGLTILTDNCGIKSLVINRFPLNGIYINNLFGGNRIEGCYIGTDTNGLAGLGNGVNGIMIEDSPTNYIGDTPLTNCAKRNVISGNNRNGIYITGGSSRGNLIQNNYIGADVNALAPIPNGWHGVLVDGGSGNQVGSTAAPKPVNVISGNRTNGVAIATTSSANEVLGNHIGVTYSGYTALGNGEDGVLIRDSGGNYVGDSSGEARNVIAGNGDDGVEIHGSNSIGNYVQGNYIGVGTNGFGPIPNNDDGVVLIDQCTQNLIGDSVSGGRNLISGNKGCGVRLDDRVFGNFIYGNYIGVNRDGLAAVSNREHGVLIVNLARDNWIGSPGTLNSGNLISGNGTSNLWHGVCVASNANGNTIDRNVIGLGVNNLGVPNAGDGVHVENAHSNTIGTAVALGGNVISANGRDGVRLGTNATYNGLYQNRIGVDTNATSARPNNAEGVRIYRAAYNFIGTNLPVRNVISGNVGSGILIDDNPSSHDNLVVNNYIGTDVSGGSKVGNSDHGVYVLGGVSNTVGGFVAGMGNVISGNSSDGVRIQDAAAMYNLVYRNLIGVNASGAAPLGNGGHGVSIFSASRNTIGDPGGRGNIIGGNGDDGVHIQSASAVSNTVRANKIGVDGTLTGNISNRLNGVWIGTSASGNTEGGTNSSWINFIWFNGDAGIRVVSGTNNALYGNSIMSNGLLGIDIGGLGVTANDVQDLDTGANFLQNYPVLYEATTGSMVIAGMLNSQPLTTYWIEFYRSGTPNDPSGYGEGYSFFGGTNATTDAGGNADFEFTFIASYNTGTWITATATDPFGNTSEFAENIVLVANEAYGDPDGDGMPTSWEGPNHLDPNDGTGTNGAAGDPDGDETDNYDEYVADTDPSDAGSQFEVAEIRQQGSTIVTYTSTNTRYYVAQFATNITEVSPWTNLYAISVAGSNGVTSAADASGSTSRLYRAQVQLLP